MKRIYILLAFIIGLNACSTSESQKEDKILMGSFTEVSPVNRRVQLEFTPDNQLRRIIADVQIKTTFTIQLKSENELVLNCNECDVTSSQTISYQVLDSNSFEISGFYPADSNEIMTFQRN